MSIPANRYKPSDVNGDADSPTEIPNLRSAASAEGANQSTQSSEIRAIDRALDESIGHPPMIDVYPLCIESLCKEPYHWSTYLVTFSAYHVSANDIAPLIPI